MPEHVIDISFSREASQVAAGREAVSWAGAALGPLWQDVRLVASELLANAVLHGRGDWMRLRLVADGQTCTLEVTDGGEGFEAPDPPEDPLDPRGRGLQIVGKLCCDWGVASGSTRVWCRIDLRTPAHPSRRQHAAPAA